MWVGVRHMSGGCGRVGRAREHEWGMWVGARQRRRHLLAGLGGAALEAVAQLRDELLPPILRLCVCVCACVRAYA